ncbi:probable low affinity copper uptake protein 2 isoform X1 [Lingula anatina]|uniref:Copper transport protein n=1 Tax=Lingula anatina TaxID=7574 RepID=A0A1S3KAU3_LINAN|nr:probable low affinity copper uptake protein 2 isoform X1 [Lingula anatina]|eukprot:XP_013419763.1 probable low affinity copper uptake protein 2 isoform X1 [Lingula anatina]
MMGMYFEFKDSLHNFLIYRWNTSTLSSFVGTIFIFFFAAMMLEGIMGMLASLRDRSKVLPASVKERLLEPISENSPLIGKSKSLTESGEKLIKQKKIKYHIGMSLLHVAKVVVAYVVMLAVMSYNAWVFVTVVIGSALGYLIFGAIQHKITTADTPDTHVINNQDDMLGTHSQTSYEPIG